MEKIPPKTYETQTSVSLGASLLEDWVGWAVEAVVAGFDSPNLRVLAALQPPFDNIEINRLQNKAFVDLNIVPLTKEQMIPFFIVINLRQTLAKNSHKKKL